MPTNAQQPPSGQTRSLLANNSVEITSPVNNSHYLADGDKIAMVCEGGADVTQVWFKVLRTNDNLPNLTTEFPTAATGWTAVSRDLTDNKFRHDSIGTAQTAPLAGNPNNKAAAIPELDPPPGSPPGTRVFGTPATSAFLGRPMQETVAVTAKACMWFAFTTNGNLTGPGPDGDREEKVDNYRPVQVTVPENAEQLTTDASNGTWRHFWNDANTESDADGRPGVTVDLQLAGYRSATYNSANIPLLLTNVGKLIGMVVASDSTILDGPFVVGQFMSAYDIDDNVRTLYLAYHDGKRWHNNSGAVSVSLMWSRSTTLLRRRVPTI